MAKPNTYPMQPMAVIDDVVRFVENPIVVEVFRNSGYSLHSLAAMYPDNDPALSQVLQLLGYSVTGYCSWHRVPESEKRKARRLAKRCYNKHQAMLWDTRNEELDQ